MREQHLGHSDGASPAAIICKAKLKVPRGPFDLKCFQQTFLVIRKQGTEVKSVAAPNSGEEAFLKLLFLSLYFFLSFRSFELVVEQHERQMGFLCDFYVVCLKELHDRLEEAHFGLGLGLVPGSKCF
jgi:hypothetical protein